MKNDVYLNLRLRKSQGKQDENGNYFFEVEASNENLDLQNQIVLQRALLDSKDNFLKHGIISYDHLYKSKDSEGRTVSDSHYIIGEPVDVYTEGKSTIVKGILYKSNELAKDIIAKLKDGSNRIRASVGGIFPKVEKGKNGVEKIYSVLWNDLALTPTPVNNTVGSASLCKSMDPEEFVKALSTGGYSTDSSTFTNGKTLQKEDVEAKTTNITPTIEDEVIQAIKDGIVEANEREVRAYLENENIKATSEMIKEILKKGGNSKMKKSTYSDEVDQILKSLENEDDKNDTPEDEEEDFSLDIDLDDEDDDEEKDEDEDDDDDKMQKGKCKKSLDDDDYVDATDILKSLRDVITEQSDQIAELKKGLEDMGNAVVKVAKLTKSLGSTPEAPVSVLNKSMNANSAPKTDRPTVEDFRMVQDVLMKSCNNNEITLLQSTKMESEVQKCMQLGTPISKETYNFINSHL